MLDFFYAERIFFTLPISPAYFFEFFTPGVKNTATRLSCYYYHRVNNINPPLAKTPNRNIWEILANNLTPNSKFGKFWQITLPRTKIRARSARKFLGFLGVLQKEIVKKVFKNGQSGGPKFWQITLPRTKICARSAFFWGVLGVLQGEIAKKVFKNGQSGGPKCWQK